MRLRALLVSGAPWQPQEAVNGLGPFLNLLFGGRRLLDLEAGDFAKRP
jgi:hypothetical protein